MRHHLPSSKPNIWKQQLAVLMVSGMLGVANILKNESKFIADFKSKNAIIKVEESKPEPTAHPNLLWKPKFYIKTLFDKLNKQYKLN